MHIPEYAYVDDDIERERVALLLLDVSLIGGEHTHTSSITSHFL